jgi:hypothetical protein
MPPAMRANTTTASRATEHVHCNSSLRVYEQNLANTCVGIATNEWGAQSTSTRASNQRIEGRSCARGKRTWKNASKFIRIGGWEKSAAAAFPSPIKSARTHAPRHGRPALAWPLVRTPTSRTSGGTDGTPHVKGHGAATSLPFVGGSKDPD